MDGRDVKAVLCHRKMTTDQIRFLHRVTGDVMFESPELARRWNVSLVICVRGWSAEQLKRVPMLPPHGLKLAFVE